MISFIKKYTSVMASLKEAITEVYLQIQCERVADLLGSAEHTLGTFDVVS